MEEWSLLKCPALQRITPNYYNHVHGNEIVSILIFLSAVTHKVVVITFSSMWNFFNRLWHYQRNFFSPSRKLSVARKPLCHKEIPIQRLIKADGNIGQEQIVVRKSWEDKSG